MLYNCTEKTVEQLIDSVLNKYQESKPKICTCKRCKQDIMAITLNNLPPHYVVTEAGKVMKQVSLEQIGGKAQVIAQIMNAIDIVVKDRKSVV